MHNSLFGHRQRRGALVYKKVAGTNYPVWTCADSYNQASVVLSDGVAQRLKIPMTPIGSQGTTLGTLFENATRTYLEDALALFSSELPHPLTIKAGVPISDYAQFSHLAAIQTLVQGNMQLQAALGGEYLVAPDTLIGFEPWADAALNAQGAGLNNQISTETFSRATTSTLPILHASVSCKWTMRRDRAQNIRLEALNLVRNRKGRLPHVAAVTMECDPDILGSLSLGTGDIDCVYHAALYELRQAADHAAKNLPKPARKNQINWEEKQESLERMVQGSRLRDISDLPLDLMV